MNLTQKEWMELDDLIAAIHDARTERMLREIMVLIAPQILEVECISWDQHQAGVELDFFITDTYRPALAKVANELNYYLPSHPLMVGQDQRLKFKKIDHVICSSDILKPKEVTECAIFREVYRKMELVEQMHLHVFFDQEYGIVVTASDRRWITAQAKFKFGRLGRHLRLAGRRLNDHARLSDRIASWSAELSLSDFSKREREVLPEILKGKSNAEIAIILGNSTRTIEKHVAAILDKVGVENRKHLIALCVPHG